MTESKHAPGGSAGDHGSGRPPRVGTPAVVVLDPAMRVRFWSPRAAALLGWTAEQTVGIPFDRLLYDQAPAESLLTAPEALADGEPLALRHRDGGQVEVLALASALEEGEDAPSFVHLSLSPLPDESAGPSAGPSAKHPAGRTAGPLAGAIPEPRSRPDRDGVAALEALFDHSPLGVAILDNDLRHVRVNEILARLDDVPADKHLGRRADEVIEGPMGETLARLQQEVLTTGRPVIDMTVPGPGPGPDGEGSRSVSCCRLDDDQGVLGVGYIIMDVTERSRSAERQDVAHRRLALLNEVGAHVADLLDMTVIAERLAETVVGEFSDYAAVMLPEAVAADGRPAARAPSHRTPLKQVSAAAARSSPQSDIMLGLGRQVRITEHSAIATALRTGLPQLLDTPGRIRDATYPADPRTRAALELGVHSMLLLPLRAGGSVLGLLAVSRAGDSKPFDDDDLAFATTVADRAGTSLDKARMYTREREGALMLQRALLPHHVPEPPGVHTAFRYVPGSSGTEAGGDWFDVTQLSGNRVALVIGDVTGHGLRAAATMGLLRTALRTLSVLDLPPAQVLRHIDDIATDLAHDPDEALVATCVYAVYDASARRCAIANAGHLPPLIVEPAPDPPGSGSRATRLLDVPSGAPLGVGGVPFETVEFDVAEGSILVLYTDGLVETRGGDISDGLAQLSSRLAEPHATLEDACDSVLGVLEPGKERDDVALLLAELSGLPKQLTDA